MDITMTQGGQRADSEVDFDCPVNNEIHYENIGRQAIGLTLGCEGSSGNIVSFEMGIDKRGTAYYYTGADPGAIPEDKYDIQSLATHEFGHGLGIDHLDAGGGCPNTDMAATMCLANGVGFGETFTRTLEDHDRHTITPLYP